MASLVKSKPVKLKKNSFDWFLVHFRMSLWNNFMLHYLDLREISVAEAKIRYYTKWHLSLNSRVQCGIYSLYQIYSIHLLILEGTPSSLLCNPHYHYNSHCSQRPSSPLPFHLSWLSYPNLNFFFHSLEAKLPMLPGSSNRNGICQIHGFK